MPLARFGEIKKSLYICEMKKLILSAALLLSCLVKAQLVVPATILNVNPTEVCPGDTMNIEFALQGTVQVATPFEVVISLQNGGIVVDDTVAFAGRLIDLFTSGVLPSGDSTYNFKRFVPSAFPRGQTCLSGDFFKEEVRHCVEVKRDCPKIESDPCDTMPIIGASMLTHTFCVPCTYMLNQNFALAERITPLHVDTATTVFTVEGGVPTLTSSLYWVPNTPGTTHFTLTGLSYMADGKACYQIMTWTFTTIMCDLGTACYSVVGIPEHSLLSENYRAFPNPFHDHIAIKAHNAAEENDYLFYDMNGRLALKTKLLADEAAEELTPGMYFLEIKNTHGKFHQKIIKE